jgi:hypothetical protein
MSEGSDDVTGKHRELMLRIAQRPAFCCGCICIPRADRRRARRVFRLTRRIMRTWTAERGAAPGIEGQGARRDRA